MNKIIVLLIGVFSSGLHQHCSGQEVQRKIDSLLQLLPNPKDDTSKVKILSQLQLNFILIADYERATSTGHDLKTLCEDLLRKEKEPKAINVIKSGLSDYYGFTGFLNRLQGDNASSLKNNLESLRLREETGNKKGISSNLTQIGISYILIGDYTEAINYFGRAKKIAEELGDKRMLGETYGSLGAVYSYQGNYTDAIKNYLEALKLFEEINYKQGMGSTHINVGSLYFELGNWTEALSNYSTALRIWEELGNKKEIGNAYLNIGSIHIQPTTAAYDLHEAMQNFSAALKICEEIGDKYTEGLTRTNMAEVYALQENYPEAVKSYLHAISLMKETQSNQLPSAYFNLAAVYAQMNHFNDAIRYYNEALALSKEIGARDDLKDIYRGLADVYERKKDYKNAYDYHILYASWKDTIFNETNARQIAEIKTKYESEKKDIEIALLNKDKDLQRAEINKQKVLKFSFIGGLATLALLSGIVLNNYRVRNKLKLQTLRNKIASDLHDDVGSTLSSISIFSEIAQQQSSEVTPMLEQIGENSRKMLEAMGDIVWTIHPDNDQFEKIIERMRSFAFELLGARKINFVFEADDNVGKMKLPMDVRKNLYLIFKEATNNMVKYSKADKASFSLSGSNNNLTMIIRDNGIGFDVNQDSQGNGIRNMKRRAEEIKGRLLIESEKGTGTTIQLLLRVA